MKLRIPTVSPENAPRVRAIGQVIAYTAVAFLGGGLACALVLVTYLALRS